MKSTGRKMARPASVLGDERHVPVVDWMFTPEYWQILVSQVRASGSAFLDRERRLPP